MVSVALYAVVVSGALALGCGARTGLLLPQEDAAPDSADATIDSGSVDSGTIDTAVFDSGGFDTHVVDVEDTAEADSGSTDSAST